MKYALHIYKHPRETILFDDLDAAMVAWEMLGSFTLIYRLNGDALEYYSKFGKAFVPSVDNNVYSVTSDKIREALKGDQ
jgi:hypothetical protein